MSKLITRKAPKRKRLQAPRGFKGESVQINDPRKTRVTMQDPFKPRKYF